ncbi:hypothetical protein LX36DRAFT_222243 [Colletotrichum falcatum]|nr:hypothetical protein LX36DRAFT_222243 [Colletotrichum falcatum]
MQLGRESSPPQNPLRVARHQPEVSWRGRKAEASFREVCHPIDQSRPLGKDQRTSSLSQPLSAADSCHHSGKGTGLRSPTVRTSLLPFTALQLSASTLVGVAKRMGNSNVDGRAVRVTCRSFPLCGTPSPINTRPSFPRAGPLQRGNWQCCPFSTRFPPHSMPTSHHIPTPETKACPRLRYL